MDNGRHRPHVYFSDAPRVRGDLMRLVLHVNPFVLRGNESIPEIVTVMALLPKDQQKRALLSAGAGMVGKKAAAILRRQMAKRGISAIRPSVEHLALDASKGPLALELQKPIYSAKARGLTLSLGSGRLIYFHQVTRLYSYHGVEVRVHREVHLYAMRLPYLTVLGSRITWKGLVNSLECQITEDQVPTFWFRVIKGPIQVLLGYGPLTLGLERNPLLMSIRG